MAAAAASTANEELFQRAKAYLMAADDDGASVYDHLHHLVKAILDENPKDVAAHPERFAEVSALLKKHNFTYGARSAPVSAPPAVHATQLERNAENRALFERRPPEVSTTIEQPTPYTTVTTTTVKPRTAPPFASVVAQNALWRHCGVGLPDVEALLVDQSIARLAAARGLEEVRFVGKIFGTRGNYLVVSSKRFVAPGEGVFEEVNTMPKPPRKKVEVDVQPEPGFKGCNRLSFWVAPHAAGEWTLLPDVTPQQINAARAVRKLFTGDLTAPVVSSPAFPWPESVYLRAQLSRLLSATYVAPNGALERVEPEEDAEEEADDDDKPKGPKPAKYTALTRASKEYAPDEEQGVHALLDVEQWVHAEGHVMESGRHTKVPEKPEVEGEEEPAEEEPKDDDEDEENQEEEEPKEEEEEKELFLPLKKDFLYAVVTLPQEPSPEDADAEGEGDGEAEAEGEDAAAEEDNADANKPIDDEEVADDDPLRRKIPAWCTKAVNAHFKKHAVATVRSLRWPGAVAYAANGAKQWGCVYIGNGLKKTDHAFTPVPAPPIVGECKDITEVMDATAATEKLVQRGEEPKENDSEDEKEEEEPEEDM